MLYEQLRTEPSSDQIWAAWKGVDPEDMKIPVIRHAPAQAVIHLSSTVLSESYASGSDFPGDIPFGD